jgi:hypothetical protein
LIVFMEMTRTDFNNVAEHSSRHSADKVKQIVYIRSSRWVRFNPLRCIPIVKPTRCTCSLFTWASAASHGCTAVLLYRPLWMFQLWPPDTPAPNDAFRTLAVEVGIYGRGIGPGILPKCRLPRYISGSFTCSNSARWEPRLYFPSVGRSAEDFSALKKGNLEPPNLGTRG